MGELRLSGGEALGVFHPLVQRWFGESVGEPTEIQRLAWPRIAAGEHVLVSAPTGSGKTLTAFLYALDALLTGRWLDGPPGPRVLYVSPLKALNNDIHRNLERPLEQLLARFISEGLEPPSVRSMVRSGDTPQAERRRMLKDPPEVLITTPESLNILLTSKGGRSLLEGLRTVILDEIHAVAGSKRGTHLLTAVDRLVPLSGEFQRVALSATVEPMDAVARLVGGYELLPVGESYDYRPRPVSTVRSKTAKSYALEVRFPFTEREAEDDPAASRQEETLWQTLAEDFGQRVGKNRSTLLFANSRRLTEKVARLMSVLDSRPRVYSHHGSLSREVRSVVEKRLKEGDLDAIVATNSLELGIDIGALDEVLLVQTPRSAASAVQRVGRAGHGVGEVSCGVLYPTHGRDFLDAAVVTRAVVEQEIEPLRPVDAPLDVLAQVLLSMVIAERWKLDELYAAIRTSAPYRHLERRSFDLVIELLAGRYADSRIRELHPRITLDRVRGTVRARPGAERLLYTSGGTIADRGYYTLRVEKTLAKVGELDEEFVWERSVGDTFTLGSQSWQVRKITHNDVLVAPGRGGALAPFWRADAQDRSFAFCQKVGEFLAGVEGRLASPELVEELERLHHFEPQAATELVRWLELQHGATGRLPGSQHVLVERCRSTTQGGEDQVQKIFHTLWGGGVNRPLAMALQAAWEERFGDEVEIFQDDDCLLVRAPRDLPADEILALVPPDHVEVLLRRKLEATGFFGARFRTAAATSLLLPRASWKRRTPLWLNRQRAKKLMAAVQDYGDFPVLLETWRTCLRDDFEMEVLKEQLRRVQERELPLIEVRTDSPSPMAAGLLWQHTNFYMYQDDTPETSGGSMRQDLLQELVFSSHLRPRLPRELCDRFRAKVQRLAPGYAPSPGPDLLDWLTERLLLTQEDWHELLAVVATEHGVSAEEAAESVGTGALAFRWTVSRGWLVASVDRLPRLLRSTGRGRGDLELASAVDVAQPAPPGALDDLDRLLAVEEGGEEDLVGLVGEWARFEGPFEPELLQDLLGVDARAVAVLVDALAESGDFVLDELTRDATTAQLCDAQNLEILLRWLRQEGRPSFEPLPPERLPLFLADHQGLTAPGGGVEDLEKRLEQLFGYPARAELWESEILPARLTPYFPAWLDSVLQTSDLLWAGCGERRLTFTFPEELPILFELGSEEPVDEGDSEEASETDEEPTVEDLFPSITGRQELGELVESAARPVAEVHDHLWRLAWQSRVSNDTFHAVRHGLAHRFRVSPATAPTARRGRYSRRGFDRWKSGRGSFGRWFPLEIPEGPGDALEREELGKERARLLLDRYGLLCRELVARELPTLRWSAVFRALRLMELGGEVLAGHFFHGIQGLQFLTHDAFRRLQEGLPEDAIYWFCAADPASLCGVDIEGLKGTLPPRLPSHHLVYHGERLVLVSRRRGRDLEPHVPPDHPRWLDYLGPLESLLIRPVAPLTSLEVETIGGEPALSSPYLESLGEVFRVTREAKSVRLWKRYGAG